MRPTSTECRAAVRPQTRHARHCCYTFFTCCVHRTFSARIANSVSFITAYHKEFCHLPESRNLSRVRSSIRFHNEVLLHNVTCANAEHCHFRSPPIEPLAIVHYKLLNSGHGWSVHRLLESGAVDCVSFTPLRFSQFRRPNISADLVN